MIIWNIKGVGSSDPNAKNTNELILELNRINNTKRISQKVSHVTLTSDFFMFYPIYMSNSGTHFIPMVQALFLYLWFRHSFLWYHLLNLRMHCLCLACGRVKFSIATYQGVTCRQVNTSLGYTAHQCLQWRWVHNI